MYNASLYVYTTSTEGWRSSNSTDLYLSVDAQKVFRVLVGTSGRGLLNPHPRLFLPLQKYNGGDNGISL